MRYSAGGRRLVAIASLLACFLLCAPPTFEARQDATAIDRVFNAYNAGDADAVAHAFVRSDNFRALRLTDRDPLGGWLKAWEPRRAAFLLELASVASDVAPAYIWPIVAAGQRYVLARPRAPGAADADDAFERQWHHTALALLQRHNLATFEARYLVALKSRLAVPANAPLADGRLLLAYAIAQEQLCWHTRPELQGAGAVADDVTRASNAPVETHGGVSSEEFDRHRTCLYEARSRFDDTRDAPDAGMEARVRAAWIRYQLGENEAALETLDSAVPGDDRVLTYWAALVGGRIDEALGRHQEAERAFRAALTAFPQAQSAGLGLAMTLVALDRPDEATEIARALRSRTTPGVDPWWTYLGADQRFVKQWLATLRAAHP